MLNTRSRRYFRKKYLHRRCCKTERRASSCNTIQHFGIKIVLIHMKTGNTFFIHLFPSTKNFTGWKYILKQKHLLKYKKKEFILMQEFKKKTKNWKTNEGLYYSIYLLQFSCAAVFILAYVNTYFKRLKTIHSNSIICIYYVQFFNFTVLYILYSLNLVFHISLSG